MPPRDWTVVPASGMAQSHPHVASRMADDQNHQNSNFLAGVAFALLLAALVVGVWAFPRVYAYMTQQDCIASGRTNCVRYAPADAPPQ